MGKIILVAVLVLLLVGGGFFAFRITRPEAEALPTTTVVEVTRGDLELSLTSSGNLSFPYQLNLSFGVAGTIQEIGVRVGDGVKEGQVLARLEADSLERALVQAEANLRNAEIALEKVKATPSPEDLATAEATVASAKASLALAELDLPITIKQAEVAVKNAQDALTQAEQDLAITKKTWEINILKAADNLSTQKQTLSDRLWRYYGFTLPGLGFAPSDDPEAVYLGLKEKLSLSTLRQEVEQAWTAYVVAKGDLELSRAQQSRALANGQNSIDKARENLEISKLQQSLNVANARNSVDKAKETLRKAEQSLTELKAGPDPLDIELREIQVKLSRLSLDQAKEQLARATLTAPFSGLVATIAAQVGSAIGANATLLTLVDPEQRQIEVVVDEVDILSIRVGQQARIAFDALPNLSLLGKVETVYPLAQRQAGVINYRVVVALALPGGERRQSLSLREGLTAIVDIIQSQRQGVLLVPDRAVSRRGRETMVKVMAEGQVVERPVQIGLSNDEFTEITSGLEEGEKVVVEATTSTSTSTPMPMRSFPGGGFQGGPGMPFPR